MGTRDDRVDAYIAKSAAFARPILEHLRGLVHRACPEAVETMKWSFPHFDYKGMLCSMAAFKNHASFGFWKQALVIEGGEEPRDGMGSFGKLERIEDLPDDDLLIGYIHKAMQLNDDGVKSPARPKSEETPRELVVPDDLTALLADDPSALATFDKLSPIHMREYVDWIVEAKTQATRSKRLAKAVAWMAEGKPRNWKYLNC